jgi:ethanolamine utilization protein EutP (predicted NTPase)
LYGSDKITDQKITQYIKYPSKSDYSLPGAIFYPNARYKACLSVTQGYKSAIVYQRNKNLKAISRTPKLMLSQETEPNHQNDAH